ASSARNTSCRLGWLAQAASSSRAVHSPVLIAIDHPPLRRISETEFDDRIEQRRIVAAGFGGGAGEVLVARQVRIGVGFERIDAAVGFHAEIHARIAGEPERTIDAPREFLEARGGAG